MLDQSRILTFSGRLYTLLLLAYPTRFRHAYGREMAQVFRDDVRGTFQESGSAGLISLWFLVVLDLLKTAFAEHIWEVFHMPVEKLERWTGLAAILGGALFVFLLLSDSLVNDVVHPLILFLPVMVLWAIALTGLYWRLPADSHPGNKVTYAAALVSLLLGGAGILLLEFTGSELGWSLVTLGFYGLMMGIAGMGVVALVHRAMGVWRFVPLLLAGTFLGFFQTGNESDIAPDPVQLVFLILIAICWLLLGIAIWTSTEEEAGPALPA